MLAQLPALHEVARPMSYGPLSKLYFTLSHLATKVVLLVFESYEASKLIDSLLFLRSKTAHRVLVILIPL